MIVRVFRKDVDSYESKSDMVKITRKEINEVFPINFSINVKSFFIVQVFLNFNDHKKDTQKKKSTHPRGIHDKKVPQKTMEILPLHGYF